MTVTMDLQRCSRCWQTHVGLAFRELSDPLLSPPNSVEPGAVIATHFAICPATTEPILILLTSA